MEINLQLGCWCGWGKVTVHLWWKRWHLLTKYSLFSRGHELEQVCSFPCGNWLCSLSESHRLWILSLLRWFSGMINFCTSAVCAIVLFYIPIFLFYSIRLNLISYILQLHMSIDCFQLGHLNVYHIQNKMQDLSVCLTSAVTCWSQKNKAKKSYSMGCCVSSSLLFDSKGCC